MVRLLLIFAFLISQGFCYENRFVIIIPSYNNEKYCKPNLESVFKQNHLNYRVLYVDDCSSDHTVEEVEKIVTFYGQQERFTLIKNERRLLAAENIYRAVHSCDDHEIVVLLDGDDWFPHEDVLTKLNAVYSDPDVWLTFGSYMTYPGYQKGVSTEPIPPHVLQSNTMRRYSRKKWIFSHLKTCYAALFKKIRLEDLLQEGEFLKSSYDQAFMIPMVEMAGEHVRFISDVLYVYNRETPLNDDKVNLALQRACARYIWELPPYSRLPILFDEAQ